MLAARSHRLFEEWKRFAVTQRLFPPGCDWRPLLLTQVLGIQYNAWNSRAVSGMIKSLISFPLPFFRDGLLVVMDDDTTDLLPAVLAGNAQRSVGLEVVSLRMSELWELALPDPFKAETFSMPYWIRESGRVVYGEDLRSLVPTSVDTKRLLPNHLEISTYLVRNSLILDCLTKRRYIRLLEGLVHQGNLLMMTALLTRDIWRVYPTTVRAQFVEVFSDGDLQENLALFEENAMRLRGDPARKELATRLVWLHEEFVRHLWRHAG